MFLSHLLQVYKCYNSDCQQMRRKRQTPLSSFLKDQPNRKYKAVSLESKGITFIDGLTPLISSEIQSLNLRNNKIVSLNNFDQFIQLKELDISGNKIGSSQEFQKLRGLPKLSKLFFSNNPFLDEPINEQFLEFLIDKETDIDILSFDLVKEVQKDQIKIIFLKNYINKIGMHSQLLKKEHLPQTTDRLKTSKFVEKVIPQFYPSISSPKLTTTVKKQAFVLKRQEQKETFEDALVRSKRQKERQIDQLIESIVGIVHQSDTFMESQSFLLEVDVNENTISFSPEKNQNFSPEGNKSPIIKNSRRKFGSANKFTIDEVLGSRVKKEKFKTPIVKKQMPTTDGKPQYIKVIDLQEDNRPSVRKSPQVRISPSLSTIKNSRSKISDQSIYINEQLTPQKIETIYFKTLNRVHPMFSLLYSPAASLNNEQKNILLEALKVNHRQNFTQLLKERWNNQNLMRQLELLQVESEQKLQHAYLQNRILAQQQKDSQWLQKKYRALQEEYNELFHQLKSANKNQSNKEVTINSMETSYKKLKQGFIQNKQKLQQLQKCEEIQQKLVEKHRQFIKHKCFTLLTEKASQWMKVLEKQKKAHKKHQRQLYNWGMQSFITVGLFKLKKDKFTKKQQYNLMKSKFTEWKNYLKLQKKQKQAIKKIKKKWTGQFWHLLRKYEAQSKLMKLRNIWALRFEKQNKYKSHFKVWKRLFLWRKQGQKAAERAGNLSTQNLFMKSWKQLIQKRKLNIQYISDKHLKNKTQIQMKKLLYLMKRQIAQNIQKEHTVRVCHQHQLRKRGFAIFKRYITANKFFQQRNIGLRKYLFKRYIKIFKRLYRRKLRLLTSFKMNIRKQYRGVIKKVLNRQKQVHNFASVLLKRKMGKLIVALSEHRFIQKKFKVNSQHLSDIRQALLLSQKLRFIKQMLVYRLKGRNYVKKIAIKEMNFQMDLNDQKALELIKQGQFSIEKCETQIIFLKRQIQNQSARQMALLAEKDAMMLTINESHEIMVELGRQISLIRQQSFMQERKYNELAKRYNQAVELLQRSDKKERLLDQAQKRSPF